MSDDPTPKPVLPDLQDPLPESNWTWRRIVTILVLAASFAVLAGCGIALFKIINGIVGKIDSMSAAAVAQITVRALATVEQMFRLMFWTLMVALTYYMIAPSAEQIVKMLQTAGLLKAGVQIAQRSVETPERREVAATVGQPPQPVTPPVEAPAADTPAPLPDDMPPISASEGGSRPERLL